MNIWVEICRCSLTPIFIFLSFFLCDKKQPEGVVSMNGMPFMNERFTRTNIQLQRSDQFSQYLSLCWNIRFEIMSLIELRFSLF